MVGPTNTVRHASLVNDSSISSGACTSIVIVPASSGSCGPSASPNSVTVISPEAPTAGVTAEHDREQTSETNVYGAVISSVIAREWIGRPSY